MATRFKIINGSDEQTFTVKPKHVLRAERENGTEASVESTYRLAWYASGSTDDFDTWIDAVDEIVPIIEDDETEAEIPPTTAGSRRSRS